MTTETHEIPCHWTSIGEKLNEMRKNSILTDVVLYCKGKIFEAHRNILCSASQYFYQMFTSRMKESTTGKIELHDVEPDGLEMVLDILYSGRVINPSCNVIIRQVVKTSHFLCLDDIFIYYRDVLLKQITAENLHFIWKVGNETQDEKILLAVYAAVEKYMNTSIFLKINAVRIAELVNYLKKKSRPESSLLRIVILWVTASEKDRMSDFSMLLNLISFDKIANEEVLGIFWDPVVQRAELIRNKLLEIFYSAFQAMSALEMACEDLKSVIFLGQNEHNTFQIQIVRRGLWLDPLPLNTESGGDIQIAQLVCYQKEELCVVTKENDNYIFLNFFNPQQLQILRRRGLGAVWASDTVCAAQCGPLIIVFMFTAGGNHLTVLKYSKISDSITLKEEFETVEAVVSMQLLTNKTDIYRVIEWARDDKPNYLSFAKATEERLEGTPFKYGHSLFNIKADSWFAYLAPNHIVVRFFPGRSVYYSLSWGLFSFMEDNNQLASVVFLRIVGSSLWCATSDGKIFIQNKNQPKSDWKIIHEDYKPLIKYTDMTAVKTELETQQALMMAD